MESSCCSEINLIGKCQSNNVDLPEELTSVTERFSLNTQSTDDQSDNSETVEVASECDTKECSDGDDSKKDEKNCHPSIVDDLQPPCTKQNIDSNNRTSPNVKPFFPVSQSTDNVRIASHLYAQEMSNQERVGPMNPIRIPITLLPPRSSNQIFSNASFGVSSNAEAMSDLYSRHNLYNSTDLHKNFVPVPQKRLLPSNSIGSNAVTLLRSLEQVQSSCSALQVCFHFLSFLYRWLL